MHLWISRPGRTIDEVARWVHAYDVVRAAEGVHRNAARLHVPASVENFLGHERHAVRHLGGDKILLSLRNGFGNAFDQLFEVGAMRGVVAVGTAILARRRGVRVCGGYENTVGAKSGVFGRQCLGAIEVIAADQAVVYDHNGQPRLAVITHNRASEKRIMRLVREPFAEGANQLHGPDLGRDIHLCRAGTKLRPPSGGKQQQGGEQLEFHLSAFAFAGIEVGVLGGHAGTGVLAPGGEFGGEGFHLVRMFRGKVGFLADIVSQIEQLQPPVLVPFDELPVALAHGGRGGVALIAVVRVMPVERAAVLGFAAQGCGETHAVNGQGQPRFETGHFDDGREKVRAGDGGVVHAAGLSDAGPADHHWLADAAFVHPAFATAQGEVTSGMPFAGGEAAVVAHEKHNGVVLQPVFLEAVEHLANGEIHRLYHATVHGVFLYETHLAVVFLAPLGFETALFLAGKIFVAQIGARDQRSVHGIKRKISEERLILIGSHEFHRFAGKPVGQVLTVGAVF